MCYRSAIAAIHQGFHDGSLVSLNTDLSILLKGIYVVAARPRTYRGHGTSQQYWNTWWESCLSHYTWHLCKSVAVKTVVFLKLALARQWDWVHSCRIDSGDLWWENGGVLLPSVLLDKNQLPFFTSSWVNLPSFKEFSLDNRVHGPVRALKWYIVLSKPLKKEEVRRPSSSSQGSLISRQSRAQCLVGWRRPYVGQTHT